MGVTLEGHMTQREMVARQGEQEACGALNGGQMGEGGWGRGGGGDGDDPFRCHIYILKNSMRQPGNYVTKGSSQMRACLGLCLGGQPGRYALALCSSMTPPSWA